MTLNMKVHLSNMTAGSAGMISVTSEVAETEPTLCQSAF